MNKLEEGMVSAKSLLILVISLAVIIWVAYLVNPMGAMRSHDKQKYALDQFTDYHTFSLQVGENLLMSVEYPTSWGYFHKSCNDDQIFFWPNEMPKDLSGVGCSPETRPVTAPIVLYASADSYLVLNDGTYEQVYKEMNKSLRYGPVKKTSAYQPVQTQTTQTVSSATSLSTSPAYQFLETFKLEVGTKNPIKKMSKTLPLYDKVSNTYGDTSVDGYYFEHPANDGIVYDKFLRDLIGPPAELLATYESTGYMNDSIVCTHSNTAPLRVFCADLPTQQRQPAQSMLDGSSNVHVVMPNGGEGYRMGDTMHIKWDDNTHAGQKDIFITDLKHHGIEYAIQYDVYQMGSGIDGSFSTSWTVQAIPAGSYKLQVCKTGTDECDMSDGYFAVISQ